MNRTAAACQLSGAAGTAVGLGMIAPWLGVTVGGILLVAFGVASELASRRVKNAG